MKKYIGILSVLLLTMPVQAGFSNCTSDKGGEIVTVSGQTFCRSAEKMNWWSAYTWCQAMGGHLPTVTELCPTASSITHSASCGRNYGKDIWTATPMGANSANNYTIRWSGTAIHRDTGRSDYFFVYCAE